MVRPPWRVLRRTAGNAGGAASWLGLVLLAAGGLALAVRAAPAPPPQDTLQLRVIAASNRPADQALKLQVRDAVLAALAAGLVRARTEPAALAYATARLPDLRRIAGAVAARAGQGATVTVGEAALPPRRLGLISFPPQRAPTVLVTLGAGRGHNWWTVLFPPLALVTVRGDLVVVGPGGASTPVRDMAPAQRAALLAWIAGRTGVAEDSAVRTARSDTLPGARVQVRFLLWDLARGISWPGLRDTLLAFVPGGGAA